MNLQSAKDFGIAHIRIARENDLKLRKMIDKQNFYLKEQDKLEDKYKELLFYGESKAMKTIQEKIDYNRAECKILDRKISEKLMELSKIKMLDIN